jgi:hypothetical protein
MNECISPLGKEWSDLAENDVQAAFTLAYNAIETEQIALKSQDPSHALLRLVLLHESRTGCNFDEDFNREVFQRKGIDPTHSDIRSRNYYYTIGAYVELLREENLRRKSFNEVFGSN